MEKQTKNENNGKQQVKRLLCFGDSNTYGYYRQGRLAERWSVLAAALLAPEIILLEEGLSGRTIGEYDPIWPEQNGLQVLTTHLQRQQPDALCVMLGTNDAFYRGAAAIAEDLQRLLQQVRDYDAHLPLLVLAPVPVADYVIPDGSTRQLAACFAPVAAAADGAFADAGSWGVELDRDGCHYSPAGHQVFARCFVQTVREWLGD